MASLTGSRFFGIDLQRLRRELRAAWQKVQEWPVLTWLSPAVPVRLRRADGQTRTWLIDGVCARVSGSDDPAARFAAVELPEDSLLLRRIELPSLSNAEVAQAAALEVASASPFAVDDLVWGHATRRMPSGNLEIQIALASRNQVASLLQDMPVTAPQGGTLEVWAIVGSSTAIVFGGFGELRRLAYTKGRRRVGAALLVVALVVVTAIALTPVAQARLRAVDAQHASHELTKRVEPLTRQRAGLMRNIESGQALQELLAERADPLAVLDLLTRVLPDDTSLLGLNIQGHKVSITGATADAASLMQQLSARPELREVRAPTPATRPLGTTKDSFNIEFNIGSVPKRPEAASVSQSASPQATASGTERPASNAAAAAGAPVTTGPALIAPLAGTPPDPAPTPQASPTVAPSPGAQPVPQPATASGASFGGATVVARPPAPVKAP